MVFNHNDHHLSIDLESISDTSSIDAIDFYQLSNLDGNQAHLKPDARNDGFDMTSTSYTSYNSTQPINDIPPANAFSDTDGINISQMNYEVHNHDLEDSKKKYEKSSKIFLGISIVSAMLILFLQAFMYAVLNIHKKVLPEQDRFEVVQTYLALFIFASIYQIILTIIGLRTKNMLLLAFLCFFYLAMSVYTGIQYLEINETIGNSMPKNWRTATKATNIATIVVIVLTFFLQVSLIYFNLMNLVKWSRFKKIGANSSIKKMYLMFQVHRSLLIFDFFFFLGFTIQFSVIILNKKSVEFALTITVIPLTILLLIADDISVTRELLIGAFCSVLLFLCGIAYCIFKVIRLYTKYSDGYFPGRKSLTAFGVVTIILLVATVVVEVMMMNNFNKGLRPFINNYYKHIPGHGETNNRFKNNGFMSGIKPHRISDHDDADLKRPESLIID